VSVEWGLSQKQKEGHVKTQLELAKLGDLSFLDFTEDSLSAEIDEALQNVAAAQQQGAGLQESIDKVWLVFYNQFPSGS
jgi:hypothetical protein